MKRTLLLIAVTALSGILYPVSAQVQAWIDIGNDGKTNTEIALIANSSQETVIDFSVNAFDLRDVNTGLGTASIAEIPDGVRLLESGAPDLPRLTASVIIPDQAGMTVEVLKSNYVEYSGVNIAPSKGNLLRNVDPDDVPYQYGSVYQQDAFWPGTLASLRDPYIFRDYRGVVVLVNPVQYNPVTKTLRVYSNITVKVSYNNLPSLNTFNRTKAMTSMNREFSNLYKSHFLNFTESTKYTPITDHPGNILIISYGSYMTDMQPLVDWKILEGIPTEMVDVASIGNTTTALKAYILNYYNTHDLTYVLLVGDFAQVTSPTANLGGVTGAKDIEYAFISGSDHYPEFLVGRFSAESNANVQTQVFRTIQYEKEPTPGDFYEKNIGICSSEGPGDDNEYDYTHVRNMLADLNGFTYTSTVELMDGSQGGLDAAGNPTAANVSTAINPGAGCIVYTGHGGDTQWVTSGFSNTNVAALTNTNKLPFIYSVSCVIGHFNTGTCFCEAWMRSTAPEGPIGAVGIYGSTINQSWSPPMEGQDEMIDILVETYSNNIRRTFAGIGINGSAKMLDTYNDVDMMDTWTIFGDPSLMVRTQEPMTMNVTHMPTLVNGSTTFTVDCDVEGAYVAITYGSTILGTGYVSGGSVDITLNPAPSTVGQDINVCATAFNYVPYVGTFEVVNSSIPLDAQLSAIVQPNGNYPCSNIQMNPKVLVKNMGTTNLTSATVSYQIDGGSAVSQPWTGNLATNQADTVTFPAITLSSGAHNIVASVTNPNNGTDGYTANNQLNKSFSGSSTGFSVDFSADITTTCQVPVTVTFTNSSANASGYMWNFGDGTTSTLSEPTHTYTSAGLYDVSLVGSAGVCGSLTEDKVAYIQVGATPPVVNSETVCYGEPASLTASGSGTLNWYDSPSGGSLVYTGTTMNIPAVTTTTTYYVENYVQNPSQNVGNTQSSTNGSFFTSAVEHYLVFDCFAACQLVSVEFNAGAAGNRTFQIRSSTDAVLDEVTVNVPAGVNRVNLNLDVPVGTDLRLVGPVSPNLYRNNAGCTYPYEIAGLVSIKYSSAGTSPTGYYYYFYEWELKQADCPSALIPVTAEVSIVPGLSMWNIPATGASNADGSAGVTLSGGNGPFTYSWSNGGTTNMISGLVPGDYYVTVTDANGCEATETVTVSYTSSVTSNTNTTVKLFPSPSSGKIDIQSPQAIEMVTIYDMVGNKISQRKVSSVQVQLDLSALPEGVYFAEIKTKSSVFSKRFVIQH